MIYTIQYSDRAKGWIDKNLIGTSDPRQFGKGLS